MIARAALATALVLVPRGEGELAVGARRQLAAAVGDVPLARRSAYRGERRVDDVAVRREEARVTRLEAQDLAPGSSKTESWSERDDVVAAHAIGERRVGHRERDVVARLDVVDVRERREVRRAVAGDVDQVSLARAAALGS